MAFLSNYALHLQASLLNELRIVVEAEGTTLNQFINVSSTSRWLKSWPRCAPGVIFGSGQAAPIRRISWPH